MNLFMALRHKDNGTSSPRERANSGQTLGGRVYSTKGPATAMRNRWRKQGFEADSFVLCAIGDTRCEWLKLP